MTQTTVFGQFDPAYPAIGASILVAGDVTGFIAPIQGVAVNTLTGNPMNFPDAIAAVAYLNSPGNNIFGFTSQVNVYSRGNASNEFDLHNFCGPPSPQMPPDYSTGTKNINLTGLYLGAGGDYNSTVALSMGQDGYKPQNWLYGIYVQPKGIITAAFRDDSSATASIVINGTHKFGIDLSGGKFTAPIVAPLSCAINSSHSPGTKGSIQWDDNFVYVCTAPDLWKRTRLELF